MNHSFLYLIPKFEGNIHSYLYYLYLPPIIPRPSLPSFILSIQTGKFLLGPSQNPPGTMQHGEYNIRVIDVPTLKYCYTCFNLWYTQERNRQYQLVLLIVSNSDLYPSKSKNHV